MFNFLKRKNNKTEVFAPANGTLKPLCEVKDEVFSKGLVGKGFAIMPNDSMVYSPVEGEVAMIFPTKHAIGIKTKDGLEFILHIGVDTVLLKGEGFEVLVKEQDVVKPGTPLLKVDYEYIKSQGLEQDVICVVSNATNFDLIADNYKLIESERRVAYCEI
ncbi:PTS system IIA component, Glc family [Clostridium amylolyticum]|uniref:PTS system IIA component, Glc family n=1 Tax=Clostridium amylolyticum TaxID=1121298 RepID=A0A1M6C3M9_9CLOT|nr:PTS glucose transporter subunit IIA [Clostridium amylolyticum]SHI55553.1 PTS system IIA component, Glc family [Clostridium amylolyticum]